MNPYLISSAIIGAVLGVGHGWTSRATTTHSVAKETLYCVRDGIVGAGVYPFMLPIALYQLVAQQTGNDGNGGNVCIFQIIRDKFNGQIKSNNTSEHLQ
jgi:hypothetical protein